MQETDFPFEIIVHDDASTDGTRAIIEAYAAQYPTLIRPILQVENQWSKNIMPFLLVFPMAQGRYIALCEGDDYWVDKRKLQKQVDFLEKNNEYGLVCTDMVKLNQKQQQLHESGIIPPEERIYEDLISRQKSQVWTLTTCFRKNLVANLPLLDGRQFFLGDIFIFLFISLKSKFYFIPDITSVYRVLEDSASHFTDRSRALSFAYKTSNTILYFLEKYPIDNRKIHIEVLYKNMRTRFKYSIFFGSYDVYKEVSLKPPAKVNFNIMVIQLLYRCVQWKPIFNAIHRIIHYCPNVLE